MSWDDNIDDDRKYDFKNDDKSYDHNDRVIIHNCHNKNHFGKTKINYFLQ